MNKDLLKVASEIYENYKDGTLDFQGAVIMFLWLIARILITDK